MFLVSEFTVLSMRELFQLSVILHFPPEVYLRRGVGELAPLLVRALHENEISALQFLRGGLARVTVRSSAYREELLSSDFLFEDTPIPVTPADRPTISVYLRDLPVEISDGSVRSALESFGDVFSVRSTVYKDFPSIRNGTRVLLMSVHPVVAQCSWFYMSYVVSWSTRLLFYLSSVRPFASGLSALGPVLALQAARSRGP